MKLVTFAKSLAPFVGGEKRLVPDAVAEELEAEGCLSASEDWPPRAADAVPEQTKRPVLQPNRAAVRGGARR